jgi:hypothetical protein
MKEINNKNDRLILILLEDKEKKTCLDKRKIRKLRMMYPDNENYRNRLTAELLQSGYLTSVDLTPERPAEDKDGNVVQHEFSPPSTNRNGLLALRKGVFASEYAKKAREKRIRTIDIIVKLLAIIGGVLGIINTIKLFFA